MINRYKNRIIVVSAISAAIVAGVMAMVFSGLNFHQIAYLKVPNWVYAALTGYAGLGAYIFALIYGFGSKWRSRVQGVMFMFLILTVAVLLTVIFCTFFFDEYAFRWLVRLISYTGISAAITYAIRILKKGQRQGREAFNLAVIELLTNPGEDITKEKREKLIDEARVQLQNL